MTKIVKSLLWLLRIFAYVPKEAEAIVATDEKEMPILAKIETQVEEKVMSLNVKSIGVTLIEMLPEITAAVEQVEQKYATATAAQKTAFAVAVIRTAYNLTNPSVPFSSLEAGATEIIGSVVAFTTANAVTTSAPVAAVQ